MSEKPKVDVYTASDYAGMVVGPWSFYYGYEWGYEGGREDDPEEEWGFRAGHAERGVVASLSFESLGIAVGRKLDRDDVDINLLLGIGLCVKNGAFS